MLLECSWSSQNHEEDVKREPLKKKETNFKQDTTKKASFSSTAYKIPRTHASREKNENF